MGNTSLLQRLSMRDTGAGFDSYLWATGATVQTPPDSFQLARLATQPRRSREEEMR